MEIPKFQFAVRNDLTGTISFLPERGTPKSTGWDVKAAQKDKKPLVIRAGSYVKIPLGFRALPPEGWWLELRPRSSSFAKKQLHALYGVIDEDYEGECIFACHYLPDNNIMVKDLVIEFGEAIGQIIPVERRDMEVIGRTNEELDKSFAQRAAQRGAGGFGSTDTNKLGK